MVGNNSIFLMELSQNDEVVMRNRVVRQLGLLWQQERQECESESECESENVRYPIGAG